MSIPETVSPSLIPYVDNPLMRELQQLLETRKAEAQVAINGANAALLAVKDVLDKMILTRDHLQTMEKHNANHAQV